MTKAAIPLPATMAGDPATPLAVESPSSATAALPSATPTPVSQPDQSPTAAAATQAAPPRPTLGPEDWKALPVIPEISESVKTIFAQGQKMGNNPQAFSKLGDCGSTPAWFLGDFDRGPEYYDLGPYTALQPVIDYYKGSFDRTSLAARAGFNASALFTTLWADRKFCEANEAPIVCEYRIQRPSIAFIMLGTNDHWHPEEFEPQMRKIIEYSLASGVIPVLSTKADNAEKDWSINATIARLAQEYDIPLWNFWAAVNPLPDGGLQEDQAHLTWAGNDFSNPASMQKAWPHRNLGALQMLEAIYKKLHP